MAEAHRFPAGRRHPLRGDLGAYRAVLASRIRAQRSYRANFALDVVSALVVGLIELAEIWLVFRSAPSLGGLRFAQILLRSSSNLSVHRIVIPRHRGGARPGTMPCAMTHPAGPRVFFVARTQSPDPQSRPDHHTRGGEDAS